MSQSYQVNYSINVNSQAALNSIQKFQEATLALAECEKRIKKVTTALSNMTTKSPVLKVSTESINKKLDVVIRKLERIHSLSATSTGMLGGGGAKTSTKTKTAPAPIPAVPVGTSTGGTGNKKTKVKTPQPVKPKGAAGSNIGYKIFGPSMLDTGGIGAFEMAKGMGIAYGIAGLGSWVGSIVKDYAQYDNMMKTSYNILKTHDKGSNFQGRFDDMARTIRNVGVQTKFTAPEVADAGKFLAMAGFNIDDINKSIVPIANLALIGDTDLGATADITTNIMTGYGIAAGQIGKASDIMAMTFTSSNTTLTEIAEAYKYSASLLSAGGIGFEEATAALGILGDAGVKGSQAGTTMRTIMANIVKPTNKQQAHWDRVGVARYDKDGNVRDLLDIFQDLSAKDLGVADFYQLFHKTAAQGAVSLTKNVDKWNTVIERNFLSDGLAHKLAEEKKNTLQGMWAQLTSSFVETGMQAFAGVEGQIKDLLSKAIEWARSPEALEATKKLFTNVIELMRMMASMAHSFANLSPLFMHTIMAWAKLQVIAAPIMIVVRSLRALSNIGSGLVSVLSFFKGVVGLTSTGLVGALAPIGAALAGIAVLGGVALYNMYQENQAKLEAASGFLENWAGTVFVANGYLTKGMDPAARYLQLVYDKQLSANDKVAEYIRLRKEEMGLTSKYNIDNDGKTVADVLGDKYTQMAGVSGSSIKEMVGVLEPTWRILPAWVSKQFFVSDLSTKGGFSSGQWLSPTEKIDIYKGVKAISGNQALSETMQYIAGVDNPVIDEFVSKYMGQYYSSPLSEWDSISSRVAAGIESFDNNVNTKYNDLSFEGFGKLPADQLITVPKVWETARIKLLDIFDEQSVSPMSQALYGYKNFLMKAGEHELEDELQFFAKQGIGSFAGSLDPNGTPFEQLLRENGYDAKTNSFVGDSLYSAEEYAKTFYASFVSPVFDLVKKLPADVVKTLSWLNHPALKTSVKANKLKVGVGALRYDDDGNLMGGDAESGVVVGSAPSIGGAPTNQDAYQQKYRSNSAAPKQIIVNIENMMNVEKVDLSNPDNALAIDNLKEQMAQVLIDVVHDFDVSFQS